MGLAAVTHNARSDVPSFVRPAYESRSNCARGTESISPSVISCTPRSTKVLGVARLGCNQLFGPSTVSGSCYPHAQATSSSPLSPRRFKKELGTVGEVSMYLDTKPWKDSEAGVR